jgi:hypothetical protein
MFTEKGPGRRSNSEWLMKTKIVHLQSTVQSSPTGPFFAESSSKLHHHIPNGISGIPQMEFAGRHMDSFVIQSMPKTTNIPSSSYVHSRVYYLVL